MDLEDIPPTAEWRVKIKQGIEGARAFVFVLSPDSMTSPECLKEIDYAVASHKRLIPVVCREVDSRAVPEPLAALLDLSAGTGRLRERDRHPPHRGGHGPGMGRRPHYSPGKGL